MGILSKFRKKSETKPTIYITMGKWAGEPVEWQVLCARNGRALILTKMVIAAMSFNKSSFNGNRWETSDLRWWLNTPFRNAVFSEDETIKIQGELFCLSIEETEKFLPLEEQRICHPTRFAKTKDLAGDRDCPFWWLRSPGDNEDEAAVIDSEGCVLDGWGVKSPLIGVRPAMWIDWDGEDFIL